MPLLVHSKEPWKISNAILPTKGKISILTDKEKCILPELHLESKFLIKNIQEYTLLYGFIGEKQPILR